MKTFNREGRGPVLLYGGTINTEGVTSNSCSAFPSTKKPAIFVRHRASCIQNGGVCQQFAWGAATTTTHTSCANVAQITFVGDDQDNSGCSTNKLDFRVDGEAMPGSARDLQALALHEFGHLFDWPGTHITAGSGAPFDGTCSSGRCSIMQSGNGQSVANRHLWPHDLDCVDDSGTGRNRWERLYVSHLRGFSSSGSISNYSQFSPYLSGKSIGTGAWRYSATSSTLILTPSYFDPLHGISLKNTDGSFSWSYYYLPTFLRDLYYAPVPFTQFEYTNTSPAHARAFLSFLKPGSKPGADPPGPVYSASENTFSSYSGPLWVLERNGTTDTDLLTHLPIQTAWDPVSGTTIYAVVDTQRTYSAAHGRVRVHAGTYSSTVPNLLNGRTLPTLMMPADEYPGTSPNFNYTGKTDFPVGVACAPAAAGLASNCILAWADRGVPNGRMLYIFFKVQGGQAVFATGTPNVGVIPGSNAKSLDGVAVAYFAGKFWIAWKTIDATHHDIGYVTFIPPTNFSNVAYISDATPVVELPAWSYVPHLNYEAALQWVTHY